MEKMMPVINVIRDDTVNENNCTVSEETPLRKSCKRTVSFKALLNDDKRGKLITRLKNSSSNLLNSAKAHEEKETKNLREYFRNNKYISEDKPQDFGNYYKEESVLGEGTSSVVKACIDKITGKAFAVKVMRTKEEEKVNQAKNEFFNLLTIESDYIIKAYELFYESGKGRIWTVLEYDKDLQLLSKLIETEGYLEEALAKPIFKMLVEGIYAMHKNGLCHRDLKPNNVLVNASGSKLKIIDFNVSKKMSLPNFDPYSKKNMLMMAHFGNIDYSAPETIEGYTQYSEQVDMWSAGTILYHMLAGESPFEGENIKEVVEKISKGAVLMDEVMWEFISPSPKNLIINLLNVVPEKRFSALEALQHPWLNSSEEVAIQEKPKLDLKKTQSLRRHTLNFNLADHLTDLASCKSKSGNKVHHSPNTENYFSSSNLKLKFRSRSSGAFYGQRIKMKLN